MNRTAERAEDGRRFATRVPASASAAEAAAVASALAGCCLCAAAVLVSLLA